MIAASDISDANTVDISILKAVDLVIKDDLGLDLIFCLISVLIVVRICDPYLSGNCAIRAC